MKTKRTFHIDGMHCVSCAMLIEGELEDRGVSAACSFAKATVDVEYDPTKVTEDVIKQAVKAAGYTVKE